MRRWLCLALAACLLAGCSAVRLGYSNGETVAYWWLNSYVDLEAEQQPMVRRHLDNLFAWHRKTQLPDYARILKQAQQQLQDNVSQADALAYVDIARKRGLAVFERALPELTDLALSLDPQQIEHLEKKFSANNEKYRREYLRGDLEYRQQYRFRKFLKQAEYWMGGFSGEQEAQLRRMSDARPLDNELELAARMQRQDAMIALLRRLQAEKPAREAAGRMIREYVDASLNYFGNEQHKAYYEKSREATAGMVAGMINNVATPEQKGRALKRLQQWIDDSLSLAARA